MPGWEGGRDELIEVPVEGGRDNPILPADDGREGPKLSTEAGLEGREDGDERSIGDEKDDKSKGWTKSGVELSLQDLFDEVLRGLVSSSRGCSFA